MNGPIKTIWILDDNQEGKAVICKCHFLKMNEMLHNAMLEDIRMGDYRDYLRSIAPQRNVPKNKKGLKRLLNVTM